MPSKAAQELAKVTSGLAREECQAITRALAARRRLHEAVHDARKAIRRLRALLALIETRIPEATPIDEQLERLGDGLSSLRDAHVVVETARRVAGKHRKRWKAAIEALQARRDLRLEGVLQRDPGFLKRRALVRRLQARLEFLDWSRLRLADLEAGVENSQQRVDGAEKRAATEASPQSIHRWRRRVRRLRFQLEAVGKLSPRAMQRLSRKHPGRDPKALHKLGDALGDRRDEQMLEVVLKRTRGLEHRAELLADLQRGKPAAPRPMAPKEYPEPLLAPPQAERDIIG
jgi:CHAD domain-containing protein